MKLLALSKKEFVDTAGEKVYILAFFIQMVMVIGIIYTALLYTSITNPSAGGNFIVPQVVKVGVVGEFSLKLEGLNVVYIKTGEKPIEILKSRGLAAILVIPENFRLDVLRGKGVNFTLILDNTNVLSGYADAVISNEVAEFSEILKREYISQFADPEAVATPIKVKERWVGLKKRIPPPEFIELMYGLLIPFILLLPTFLSSNMVTDSIVGEKEKKTYEILVSSPVSKIDIILGKTLPILFIAITEAFIWILLLEIKGVIVYNVLYLLLLLLLLDVIFVGFGIGISAFSENIKDANVGVTVLILFASIAFFAPIAVKKEIYSLSPVSLISKLSSNPVAPDGKLYIILLISGVLIIYFSARLLDWKENLRL